MRQAGHILRKDLARFWPLWLLLIGFTAAHAWQALMPPDAGYSAIGLWGILAIIAVLGSLLLPVAWVLCVAVVIQEEPLVGSDAFWLTRPYSRGSLVGAKAMAVGLFVILPLLLHDLFVVQRFGLSGSSAVAVILGKDIELALLLACVAAVAVLTATFARFTGLALAVLAIYVLLFLQMALPRNADWGLLGSVPFLASMLGASVCAVVIVANQYRTRDTARSRIIGIAGLLGAGLLLLLPWSVTWGMRDWLERPTSDLGTVRLFPVADVSHAVLEGDSQAFTARSSMNAVLLPFRATDVPEGLSLQVLRGSAELRVGSAKVALSPVQLPEFDGNADQFLRFGTLPPDVLEQHSNESATLSGTLYLHAYRRLPDLYTSLTERGATLLIARQRCTALAFPAGGRRVIQLMLQCAELEPASGTRIRASIIDVNGNPVWRMSQGVSASGDSAKSILPYVLSPVHQASYTFEFNPVGTEPVTAPPGARLKLAVSQPAGLIERSFHAATAHLADMSAESWKLRGTANFPLSGR